MPEVVSLLVFDLGCTALWNTWKMKRLLAAKGRSDVARHRMEAQVDP